MHKKIMNDKINGFGSLGTPVNSAVMSGNMQKFYITTPIYYVNDKPHIGHAYTSVIADVLARFKRLRGHKVHFLTGTDEHGQKIAQSAAKAGISPQEMTNNFSENFRSLSNYLGLSNDDFIRTTEQRHTRYVQEIWGKLEARGYIYLSKYSGWYAVRDEAFYAESELINGQAPTGAAVEWVEEESYFFKLSDFQERLLEFYEQNQGFIRPEERRNEVISFVKSGLRDLSVSRTTFSWGIPVPGNAKHIIYVWLDALFNYVSALESERAAFWPCNLHLVGKDILRFHAVYWPAFLMAADLPLPKAILAHGWWTNEGTKISKSLGNVIDPLKLIEKFGLDYVRYFLMRAIRIGNDGNYSESQFIGLVNAELVNNIGNLVQRFVSFVNKYCQSRILVPFSAEEEQDPLLGLIRNCCERYMQDMECYNIDAAIGAVVELTTAANIYIDNKAPWRFKNDLAAMQPVLYNLFEAVKTVALLLQPVIPTSASAMLDMLNVTDHTLGFTQAERGREILLKEARIIFPRIYIESE